MPNKPHPSSISPLEALSRFFGIHRASTNDQRQQQKQQVNLPRQSGVTPTPKPEEKSPRQNTSHAYTQNLPINHPANRAGMYHAGHNLGYCESYYQQPQQYKAKLQVRFSDQYFTVDESIYNKINSYYISAVTNGKLTSDSQTINAAINNIKNLGLNPNSAEYALAKTMIKQLTNKSLTFAPIDEYLTVGVTPDEIKSRTSGLPSGIITTRHEAAKPQDVRNTGQPNPTQGKGPRPGEYTRETPNKGIFYAFKNWLVPTKPTLKEKSRVSYRQYSGAMQIRDHALTALNNNNMPAYNYYVNTLINISSHRESRGEPKANENAAHARAVLNELSGKLDDASARTGNPFLKQQLSDSGDYINYHLDNIIDNKNLRGPR